MRSVPASPIRFGDTLAADVASARPLSIEEARAAYGFESLKPRMRATPIWIALAFGDTAWVVLAVVVYAAWVWL